MDPGDPPRARLTYENRATWWVTRLSSYDWREAPDEPVRLLGGALRVGLLVPTDLLYELEDIYERRVALLGGRINEQARTEDPRDAATPC